MSDNGERQGMYRDARLRADALTWGGVYDDRLFTYWAMVLVLEHHEPEVALIDTTGGFAEAAPWRVTSEQEAVLTRLRDMTRGYGRGY